MQGFHKELLVRQGFLKILMLEAILAMHIQFTKKACPDVSVDFTSIGVWHIWLQNAHKTFQNLDQHFYNEIVPSSELLSQQSVS